MSYKLDHRRNRGFTIIEVMIVLAIAGLIMLIVFLAVPGLQRSSRNTQRKNDVSSIAGAIANYLTNNGGVVPGAVGANGTDLLVCGAACAAGNTETAKLGYYSPANISLVANSAAPAAATKDTVIIDTGYACNANNTGIGAQSARTAAVLFAVETSAANVAQQCFEQ
jgi:prepilin-type N-terminal cleavage/methylation domain-containing protein